jgi:hypothetical protein
LRENGIGELLIGGGWFAAKLTRWIDPVLRLNGVDDLRNGNVQFRQFVGLYP